MQRTVDIRSFLREGCSSSMRHEPEIEEVPPALAKDRPGLRINGWIVAWPVDLRVNAPVTGQTASVRMYRVNVTGDFPQQAMILASASSGARQYGGATCLNRYELLTLVLCGELIRRMRGFLGDQSENDEVDLSDLESDDEADPPNPDDPAE